MKKNSENSENIVAYKMPFQQFSQWLKDAEGNAQIVEPTAMALATSDKKKQPAVRMVLLKKFDENGFCFFTNLTSKKGQELKENKKVALCFYWGILGRQIRIEGKIEPVTMKEADDYFASRRRGSQIGAWASKQSQKIEKEGEFESRILQITQEFEGQVVPRPPFWSGFRVRPQMIEFWEEGEYRIHKRTLYSKISGRKKWLASVLYP